VKTGIAAYISGHGFGHLAQLAPVLNRIHFLQSDCRFLIRCSLPEEEIRDRLDFSFELDATPVDVGVVQKNAIEEDVGASIAQLRQWVGEMDRHVQREALLLQRFQPSVVISGISPLAFPAARASGVVGIGIATLDWGGIYSCWLGQDDSAVAMLAAAYGVCDLLLTPPMAMDMAFFPERQAIPLIAEFPARHAVKCAGNGKRRALVLFGGSDQPPFDMHALARMPDWHFLVPHAPSHCPENVERIDFHNAIRPVDVMPHVDVVVCKPGYGVLSECWRTATPIAWVERPAFPEFPMLKGWLEQSFPAFGMNHPDFRRGEWLPALEGARTCPRRFPELIEDGAGIAADIILAR